MGGVVGESDHSGRTERTVRAKVKILWGQKLRSVTSVITECCVVSQASFLCVQNTLLCLFKSKPGEGGVASRSTNLWWFKLGGSREAPGPATLWWCRRGGSNATKPLPVHTNEASNLREHGLKVRN